MVKSKLKKGLIAVLACIFVACLSIGVMLGANVFSSHDAGKELAVPEIACDEESDGYKKFTFGKTYTIDGKKYTLGDAEEECIDFHTALGLDKDKYAVTLSSFTYPNGTDGTQATTGVRHAGTYEFEINSLTDEEYSEVATIAVNATEVVIDVDDIPLFVNAATINSTNPPAGYPLHGNILTIYHGNDGWYMSKKDGDLFIESKVITNGYSYYEESNGTPVTKTIAFRQESISDTSDTVTFENGITFNVTDKNGHAQSTSNEYLASFKLTVSSDYTLTYGDKLSDPYKWVDILNPQENSFIVTKHWFIMKNLNLFADGMITTDEPYSPFGALREGSEVKNSTQSYEQTKPYEEQIGFDFFDTMTYLDKINVRPPRLYLGSGIEGTTYFTVKYQPHGETDEVTLVTRETLSTTTNKSTAAADNKSNSAKLEHYFNSSMPAGTYTLILTGEPTSGSGVSTITSEYKLYVLPKAIDSSEAAKTALANLATAIKGGVTGNYYALKSKTLHGSLKDATDALEATLNGTRTGYWEGSDKDKYYESEVTILYNREGWSSATYVDLDSDQLWSSLSTANNYKFYYSISAKNYVTLGGPDVDDNTRQSYTFSTTLYSEIDEIYNYIKNRDVYFKNVTYTGSPVYTAVPTSQYYRSNFTESDYTNVRQGASVTFTIIDTTLWGWADVPEGLVDGVGFKRVDNETLIVYFDIEPANNGWAVAPTMSPWAYRGFTRNTNFITAQLNFNADKIKIYYRVGTENKPDDGLTWLQDGSYYWLSVGGSHTVKGDTYDETYFVVGSNGFVEESVVETLNKLFAGTYILGGYVTGNNNVNPVEPTNFSTITVMQTSNRWTTTPGMTGWVYKSFDKNNFRAGVDAFSTEGEITYAVYEGDVTAEASGGSLSASPLEITFSFKPDGSLDDSTIAALNALGVSTYTLVTTRESKVTTNYETLISAITFNVTQARDSWSDIPAISGWVYNQFNADLFVDGKGNFETTTTYTVQYADASGNANGEVEGYSGSRAQLLTKLNDLPAGSYILKATTTTSDNPNFTAAEQNIRFSVTKASYEWKNNPPTIGNWIYDSKDDSTKYKPHTAVEIIYYVNETPHDYQGEVKIEYYLAELNNGVWVKTGDKKYDDSDIETASAGEYVMVITVAGGDNYVDFEYSVHFTVSKSSNDWDTKPDSYLTWAWGDLQNDERLASLKQSGLFNASAKNMSAGESYTITYEIVGTDSGNSNYRPDAIKITVTVKEGGAQEHDTEGIKKLVDTLDVLPVGNYRITVTIGETENFGSLQEVTTVSVSKASFIWNTEPYDDGWSWGDSQSNKEAKIVTPSAKTAKDNTVVFKYNLDKDNGSEQRDFGNDFSELKEYLLSAKAGKYEITVTPDDGDGEQYGYSLSNYATFTKKYVITISQSENDWKDGKGPETSYTYEYGTLPSGLPDNFETLFGEVLYCSDASLSTPLKHNGSDITDFETFKEYLKTLNANENHTLYIGVKESSGEYDGVFVKVELTVTGIMSHWDNEGKLDMTDNASEHQFVYSDELDFAEVVLPEIATGGTTEYTINYENHDGNKNDSAVKYSVADVIAWLLSENGNKAVAGTYTIVAVYTPSNESYTSLTYTVTVTVTRATPSWKDNGFEDVKYGDFGTVTIVEPELSQDSYYNAELANSIKISITDNSNGQEAKNIYGLSYADSGLSLAEYIKTLPVLANSYHTITWKLEESDNYVGLTRSCQLNINRVANNWLTSASGTTSEQWMSGQHSWTIKRGAVLGDYKVEIPEATVGNETLVITFNNSNITSELNFLATDNLEAKISKLNAYLYGKDLEAGSYSIVFTIAESGNYNGRSSSCTINIVKKDNEWVGGTLSDYSGTKVPDNFNIPTVKEYDHLLRFDITRSNGSKVNEQPIIAANIRAELAKLSNGTFTLTAYIGGDNYTASGLEEYNKDYNYLESSCTLTLDPNANEWENEDSLKGANWTWGNFDEEAGDLPMPKAKYGGDTIVYTISGANISDKEIRAADDNSSYGKNTKEENAFEAFKAFLKTLSVGSYNVTISIAATGEYTAPTPITRMFTVKQVNASWDSETKNANGKTYNWNLFTEDNETIKQPVVDADTVNSNDAWLKTLEYTLAKVGEVSSYSSADWSLIISTLKGYKAGTYTITALIEGDENHTELTYSVTVVINLAKNEWTEETTGYGTDEMVDIAWTYGSVDNQAIKFEAKYNNDKLTIQVNRTPVVYDELMEYLNSLGVGQHVIIARIAADDEYEGLEKTVRVTVSRATNSWQDEVELSIGQVSDDDTDIGWTWGDSETSINNKLQFPVATAGSSALVVVTNAGTSTVVLEATIYYVEVDGKRVPNESDIDALVRKLAALDVVKDGDIYVGYTIKVTVSETPDHGAIASDAVAFVIKTAQNDWSVTPRVEGFNFGGTVAYPSSTPYFGQGTVVYKYAVALSDDEETWPDKDSDRWKDSLSYEAGKYWLMGYVPAPDSGNYTELYGFNYFYIGAGENGWVNMPGVIAWYWDNYDKNVNLFSGSARSGGVATFTITRSASNNEDYLDLYDISTYFLAYDGSEILKRDVERLRGFEYESGNTVSDDIARVLNALKPGTYYLWVTVGGGASLGSISSETGTPFTVSKAKNGWNTPPSVGYYIYNQYNNTLRAGDTFYGRVTYTLESGDYYSEEMTEGVLSIRLASLSAGSYTLRAWVTSEDSDTYEGLFSKAVPYSTYFEVGEATNSWVLGSEPASVSGYYAELHREDVPFDYSAWLGTHAAVAADPAKYIIMDNNYKALHNGTYLYAQLLEEVAKLLPGEYIIRVSVKATNYVELWDYMSVSINKYYSRLTEDSATSLTGRWTPDGTVLDDVTIAAEGYYGTDTVVEWLNLNVKFIFERETYDNFAALKEAIKSKDSGSSYQVTVYLQETDSYYGFSQVLFMTISAAENGWDESFHKPDESFTGGESALSWQWNTNITWLGVRPLHGDKVVVRIISASDTGTVLRYFTIDPSESDQIGLVTTYIRSLDMGTYYMLLAVPSATNWAGIGNPNDISLTANTYVTFNITTADNEWTQNGEPSFSIAPVGGKYVWEYETVVTASASAKYGEVSITYYEGQRQLSDMPTDVGKYRVVFKVITPTPLNYQDISEEFEFEITKKSNGEFTVNPGVAGWAWDNYDKEANLFLGTPKSGGAVQFAVIEKNGSQVTEKIGNFSLVGGYAPANVITALNGLKAGQYYLRVTVAETANYVGFTDDSYYFSVSEAANSWIQTPQMMSWSSGNWTSKSAPIAQPRYGEPEMYITSNVTGLTIVTGRYIGEGKFEVDATALDSADIGLYTMHVTVAGSTGYYEGIDEVTVAIEIYVQGSPDEGNFWIQHDMPHMNDWVAEIDTVGTPTGTPARGKPYFVFYKAEFKDGEWQKVGEAIGAGPDSKLISDPSTYAQDFYIPMAPGDYLMYGCAINLGDSTGKDNLGEDSASPSRFTIYNRDIAWDQSVSIASILYLGDYYHPEESNVEAWGAHTASTNLIGDDVKIRYEFYKLNESTLTREYVGDTTPIEVGTYYIVAYASAMYTKEIPSEMKFEVRLSQNAWKGGTSPSIGSWSEEYNETSPNPEGYVEHGTIVYTYINKANPNVEFSEKPTAAGNYILIARVVYEGYETLEATYEFTIEPAFDITFLIICIALAVLATIMLFVVIYFAVRRNRET